MAAEHLAAAAHDRAVAAEEEAVADTARLWPNIDPLDRPKLRYIEAQMQRALKGIRDEPAGPLRDVRRDILRRAEKRSV